MNLFKALAAVFFGTALLCFVGIFFATFWLLVQTRDDDKAKRYLLRIKGVPAAALRGEWPDLPSAKLYRRFFLGLIVSWICGAASVALHEVCPELGVLTPW
jgi:hypothetical protein